MAVFFVHTVWWAGRLIFIPEKDPADVHDASILLHKCCVRWWDNQAGYADQARRDEIPPTITVELPTVRRWSQASACPSPWCLQKVLLLLCAGEGLITCCFGALFCLLPKKKNTITSLCHHHSKATTMLVAEGHLPGGLSKEAMGWTGWRNLEIASVEASWRQGCVEIVVLCLEDWSVFTTIKIQGKCCVFGFVLF